MTDFLPISNRGALNLHLMLCERAAPDCTHIGRSGVRCGVHPLRTCGCTRIAGSEKRLFLARIDSPGDAECPERCPETSRSDKSRRCFNPALPPPCNPLNSIRIESGENGTSFHKFWPFCVPGRSHNTPRHPATAPSPGVRSNPLGG